MPLAILDVIRRKNMPIIIDNIQQGSDDWFKEKLGKPSASNASKILTNNGTPSTQRTSYLYELVAERITGKREENYKNRQTGPMVN